MLEQLFLFHRKYYTHTISQCITLPSTHTKDNLNVLLLECHRIYRLIDQLSTFYWLYVAILCECL